MVTWATMFFSVMAQFQAAGLAFRIIPDMHLTLSQFSMVLTAPMFAGVFFTFAAGTLGDKYGVKRVVAAGFVLSLAGAFFRYTADSFGELFIFMFLMGIGPGFLGANVPKLLGAWFPREQIGTVMGLQSSAMGMGISAALVTSALFPTTEIAFLAAGILMLAVWILWLVLIRTKPEGTPDFQVMTMTNYIGVAVRNKNVWLVGVALMFFMGFSMVFSGFLANALHQARGMSPTDAGVVASMVTVGTIIGSLFGPYLSDRFGSIKPFLLMAAVFGAIAGYSAWIATPGPGMSFLLLLLGMLSGVCTPLLLSFPIRLPEIGPVYAGSASGLIGTLQVIGAVFIPSMVIAPLAGQNYNMLFALASLSFLIMGAVTLLLPELGVKDSSKADAAYSTSS